MSRLRAPNEVLLNHNPFSVELLSFAHNGQRDRTRKLKSHEILAHRNSNPPYFCEARNGDHEPTQLPSTRIPADSTFNATVNPCSPLPRQEQWRLSDIDEYLAASWLCRERCMACSLLAAEVHWPFAERENRKKNKRKSLLLTCRILNAGTKQSWRCLKKLFSKQFMPFSNRDHRGLHHINTAINKRTLKTLHVGGRRMDEKIQVSAKNHDFILGGRKLRVKENVEQKGNEVRGACNIDAEICRTRLGMCEKTCKLQHGKLRRVGIKRKVHILLAKASSVALDVCELLNLE